MPSWPTSTSWPSKSSWPTGSSWPGGGAAAASTPLTIITSTTVALWVRSDLDVVDSGSGTCSAWGDQVGTNDYLQGGAASIQPTINTGGPGGAPYLSFDGVDDLMGSAYVPSTTGFLWILARRGGTGAKFMVNSSNSSSNRMALLTGTGDLKMTNASGGVNSAAMATGAWFRVWANFTNSTADELRVGTPAATTGANAGGLGGLGGTWLGGGGSGLYPCLFDVLEVMWCAAKPSAGEMTALDAYVTAQWLGGVQV